MDEFETLQNESSARRGNAVSWYDRVVADLEDDRRESLDRALANQLITARTIATVLARWGFEVKPGTIQAWRRRVL